MTGVQTCALPILSDFPITDLQALRRRADLTPSEAAEEATLIIGPCTRAEYIEIENDPAIVPPALIERFKVLAAREERRHQRNTVSP